MADAVNTVRCAVLFHGGFPLLHRFPAYIPSRLRDIPASGHPGFGTYHVIQKIRIASTREGCSMG